MTMKIMTFEPDGTERDEEAGLGALSTERGNLPLSAVDAAVTITGLLARTVLTQTYRNPYDVPLEATYVFPLPDRAAVTALSLTADGREVQAQLQERGQARAAYDQAVQSGRRAAIAEQERADVFTMRVGNILPGEQVQVALTVVGPLSYEDGEGTYRLPLVVAPRYIPGVPLPGDPVGDGYAADTDAVPDASRITPPVLLPGFPNPVRLSIGVDVDPAGLPLGAVRSSLHAVVREGNHLRIEPGERANRDFILRLAYGQPDAESPALVLTPDSDSKGNDSNDKDGIGTFRLTVLPPTTATPPRPRDVVLLLDRSGSMGGWKMVAARRAAARIVDTLTTVDRFAVLSFDTVVESPPALASGLVAATDRHRFRAIEHLTRVEARGGTELLAPLTTALALLDTPDSTDSAAHRDRVIVLVTDGQVGNEDQILASVADGLSAVRVHTVGIDQAVNAGFLGRLAALGGGRCELVESEDRLDEAMDHIHRRIGAPVVTGLSLHGLVAEPGTVSPRRLPDLFPGAPVVVTGRYTRPPTAVTVRGERRDGTPYEVHAPTVASADAAVTLAWARSHLRDLEDAYATGGADAPDPAGIVATSLRFGVLCRFTAWLAVDTRVVTEGGQPHRVIQPVEPPAGWDLAPPAPTMVGAALMATFSPMSAPPPMSAPAPMAAAPMMKAAAPARAREQRISGAAPQLRRPALERADGGPDELAAARVQAAAEARRLRAAAHEPGPERCDLLADLGSRLAALARHLTAQGVAARIVAPLQALALRLGGDGAVRVAPDLLLGRWDEALATLDAFAQPGDDTTPFWKRRPH